MYVHMYIYIYICIYIYIWENCVFNIASKNIRKLCGVQKHQNALVQKDIT